MQKLIGILPLLTILLSCNDTNINRDSKLLDFGYFTIETPQSWTKVQVRGIDSYVGRIAIDNKDTLDFDLGWYSDDLSEYSEFKNFFGGKTYYINKYDTSAKLVDSSELHKIVKSNISWDTIDGRRAKILSPIHSGVGMTGIYIDSLWQAGSDIDKFNLYGNNLKPENEKALLTTLKTLKFHQRK